MPGSLLAGLNVFDGPSRKVVWGPGVRGENSPQPRIFSPQAPQANAAKSRITGRKGLVQSSNRVQKPDFMVRAVQPIAQHRVFGVFIPLHFGTAFGGGGHHVVKYHFSATHVANDPVIAVVAETGDHFGSGSHFHELVQFFFEIALRGYRSGLARLVVFVVNHWQQVIIDGSEALDIVSAVADRHILRDDVSAGMQIGHQFPHENNQTFAIARGQVFKIDIDAGEFVFIEVGTDAFNQIGAALGGLQNLPHIFRAPAIPVVRKESNDGQICLACNCDDCRVTLVVHVALCVLQSQPLGYQVGEVPQMEPQGNHAVRVPVDVKAPYQRRAVETFCSRPGMQNRRCGTYIFQGAGGLRHPFRCPVRSIDAHMLAADNTGNLAELGQGRNGGQTQ